MWRITTSLYGWNFGRYLQMILLTNTAHLCLRLSSVGLAGRRSISWTSFRDFHDLVFELGSLTLLCSVPWILVLTIKLTFSPTNLRFIKTFRYCFLHHEKLQSWCPEETKKFLFLSLIREQFLPTLYCEDTNKKTNFTDQMLLLLSVPLKQYQKLSIGVFC